MPLAVAMAEPLWMKGLGLHLWCSLLRPRVEEVQKLWEIWQCQQLSNLGRKYLL